MQFNMDGHLPDTQMTTQEKDNFSHSTFADLHREFEIPTIEDGRSVSVHFYYGQLVNVINNVLTSRRTFAITARDHEKIDAYIKHRRALDPMDMYVATFHEAQTHLRDIEKDARHMHDYFLGRSVAWKYLVPLVIFGSVKHRTWNYNLSLESTPKTVVLLWGLLLDKRKINSLNTTNSNHIIL